MATKSNSTRAAKPKRTVKKSTKLTISELAKAKFKTLPKLTPKDFADFRGQASHHMNVLSIALGAMSASKEKLMGMWDKEMYKTSMKLIDGIDDSQEWLKIAADILGSAKARILVACAASISDQKGKAVQS